MSVEELIKEALENFPIIKEIFDYDKIMKIFQDNEYSPLVYHLKKSVIDEGKVKNAVKKYKEDPNDNSPVIWLGMYLDSYYVIKDLEEYLSKLKGLDGFNSIIEHLIYSFWQGYTELEVAYYLKKLFGKIYLEPKLPNGKKVDVAYDDGDVFYVEVIAPKRHYKTERALNMSLETGKAVELPDTTDRACEKIVAELEHFSDILEDIKSVLVIDLKNTDFAEVEIEDCLLGVSKLVIMKDKVTGQYVGSRVDREKWTGFDVDPRLAKLGAIICFNKEKNVYGNSFFEKKIFQISLSDKEIKSLLQLFNE